MAQEARVRGNGNGGTEERLPSQGERWWRGGYMLLFVIAFGILQSVYGLIAIVQFIAIVLFGEPNRQLRTFGGSLAEWTREAARFLTCADERKPWPFADWPGARD
jgi:hypothetical protein